jgi:hypothetical protein
MVAEVISIVGFCSSTRLRLGRGLNLSCEESLVKLLVRML